MRALTITPANNCLIHLTRLAEYKGSKQSSTILDCSFVSDLCSHDYQRGAHIGQQALREVEQYLPSPGMFTTHSHCSWVKRDPDGWPGYDAILAWRCVMP